MWSTNRKRGGTTRENQSRGQKNIKWILNKTSAKVWRFVRFMIEDICEPL